MCIKLEILHKALAEILTNSSRLNSFVNYNISSPYLTFGKFRQRKKIDYEKYMRRQYGLKILEVHFHIFNRIYRIFFSVCKYFRMLGLVAF